MPAQRCGIPSLDPTNLTPLRGLLRLWRRFASKENRDGLAEIIRGGGTLAFGGAEVEVVDAATVEDLAGGIDEHGFGREGGLELAGELLGGIEQHGRFELTQRGVLDGQIAGDLGIALDEKDRDLARVIGGDLVHLFDEGFCGGAKGRDKEKQS